MDERIMVFIDGSNLYMGARRALPGAAIDFIKLRKWLARGRKVIRSYYYGSYNPEDDVVRSRQERFFETLERVGFTVAVTALRNRNGKFVEKGADVALAIDMVSHGLRNTYDVAILVSGDDDFLKAVEEMKRAGKIVEIASFGEDIGRRLRNSADVFLDMSGAVPELVREPSRKT